MKDKIRAYFQSFQDTTITWGKGNDNKVSNSAVAIGLIFFPISIAGWVISMILSLIARWLEKD
jgi:hypothetical protein